MTSRSKTLALYEIADQYVAIIEELVEAGGELTPALEARLNAVQDQFRTKAEAVALYVRNLRASADAALDEAKRLQAIAQQRLRAADDLTDYLLRQMERAGEAKIETDRVRLRVQANSRPTIRWLGPPETIPEPFRRITVSLDGQRAYEAYQAGALPEGFEVALGRHLRIS